MKKINLEIKMGTCTIQLHFHDGKKEMVETPVQTPEQVYNNPNEINSNVSSNSLLIKSRDPKLINLELNIKNKLLELGQFIQINHFNKLVGNDILLLIQKKKFDYKQYITPSRIPIAQLNPFQFNDTKDIYYGSWNEDTEMEGSGIFYAYKNKIVIEGFWTKGENICGRIFFPNKNIYEGAINNNLPNGKGELYTANGDKYQGEFKNGDMIYGTVIFKDDGTIYKGNFENGNFNGLGKMTWVNNIQYQGNFENSMFSGKGEIIKINNLDKKEMYNGTFLESEFNGKGKYTFSNGDIYEGEFENGMIKGYGIYQRKNGDGIKYEGYWNDDYPNGNGELILGKYKLKGFWRNGDFIDNGEKEIEKFKNVDKNIKPAKISIFPSSLSHLNIPSNNISHFSQEDFT